MGKSLFSLGEKYICQLLTPCTIFQDNIDPEVHMSSYHCSVIRCNQSLKLIKIAFHNISSIEIKYFD